jgi:hypothetical protein
MGVQRKTQLIAIVDDDESVCSAMCLKAQGENAWRLAAAGLLSLRAKGA